MYLYKNNNIVKNLIQEVSRIKDIMGCCKGTINEEKCVNPDSDMGQQIINRVADEIKPLGITNDDIDASSADSPEITDAKNKVSEMMDSIMPNVSTSGVDSMIKDLKRMKRQGKVGKEVETKQMNEQLGAAGAVWGQVVAYLAALPTGVFIVIAAWLLLRLLRCRVYTAIMRLGMICGLDAQQNLMIKLAELLLLDFRNLFSSKGFYNCRSKFQ